MNHKPHAVLFALFILTTAGLAPADDPSASAPQDRTPTDADGKRHGLWIAYHPNGKEKARARYDHGRLQGTLTLRDTDGRILEQTDFRDNQRHGLRKVYRDGELVEEQRWAHGRLLLPRTSRFLKTRTRDILRWRPPRDVQHPKLYTPRNLAALRLTMLYRFLAGLPWQHLRLDPDYMNFATAAADICRRIGRLSHHPPNPGLDEEDYQRAAYGAAHSNLHYHTRPTPDYAQALNGFMDDSDARNIDRVGHRRLILAPYLGRVGFGRSGIYKAMFVHDEAGPSMAGFPKNFSWQFIAWPPPGIMPAKLFEEHMAWHVAPNPQRYLVPDDVTVTVRPVRKSELDEKDPPEHPALKLDHKTVSREGRATFTAVVFRPNPVDIRPGRAYRVRIEGLRDLHDRAAYIEYVTVFE